MKKPAATLIAVPLAAALATQAMGQQSAPVPPVARKVPHTTSIHGYTLSDDYFWLREKAKPEVTAYLEAENAYTEELMRPTKALQETLYKEMLGRIKQTDLSVPSRIGEYSRARRKGSSPVHVPAPGQHDRRRGSAARPQSAAPRATSSSALRPTPSATTPTGWRTRSTRPATASTCCTCAICARDATRANGSSGSGRSSGRPTTRPSSTRPKTRCPSARTRSSATRSAPPRAS